MTALYIIGSLRNERVPEIARTLRDAGYDTFDDWHAGGPEADDEWQRYEGTRGRTYKEALAGFHARHVFEFDKYHLDRADAAVLVLPAGKSAHLELGYMIGRGKAGYVLFDKEPDRYDVMYLFATQICFSIEELTQELDRISKLDTKIKEQVRSYRNAPWNWDR